jgi:hypothetical protein
MLSMSGTSSRTIITICEVLIVLIILELIKNDFMPEGSRRRGTINSPWAEGRKDRPIR